MKNKTEGIRLVLIVSPVASSQDARESSIALAKEVKHFMITWQRFSKPDLKGVRC